MADVLENVEIWMPVRAGAGILVRRRREGGLWCSLDSEFLRLSFACSFSKFQGHTSKLQFLPSLSHSMCMMKSFYGPEM